MAGVGEKNQASQKAHYIGTLHTSIFKSLLVCLLKEYTYSAGKITTIADEEVG